MSTSQCLTTTQCHNVSLLLCMSLCLCKYFLLLCRWLEGSMWGCTARSSLSISTLMRDCWLTQARLICFCYTKNCWNVVVLFVVVTHYQYQSHYNMWYPCLSTHFFTWSYNHTSKFYDSLILRLTSSFLWAWVQDLPCNWFSNTSSSDVVTCTIGSAPQVDVENPDLLKFPLFSRATCMEYILHPGQMLYIPPQYWHYIRSLDISFSVSFWWKWAIPSL